MATKDSDSVFTGSIPQLYEKYLVPLIFEPYAVDITRRAAACKPASVLELAAGTGVVTRHLARELPATTSIVATDLNQAMLDVAAAKGVDRDVEWRQADAMQLPFDDESFDLVVCQFGVMFFPDKPRSFAEVRRVLKPGGAYIFNVWDRIEANQIVYTVTQALDALWPDNPPRFMHRGPHGYSDTSLIGHDLAAGGFERAPQITTLPHRSRAAFAREAVLGYCQGSPLRAEIEARGPVALAQATDLATKAVSEVYGKGVVEGAIQAHVITVEK